MIGMLSLFHKLNITMRSNEFITEIMNIDPSTYAGGKSAIDTSNVSQPVNAAQLKPLPGGSGLMYEVKHESNGQIIRIISKNDVIGELIVVSDKSVPIKNAVQVHTITVDEAHRGQGIAKSLYGIVLSVLKLTLLAGTGQTPGGRRNWLSLANVPGVDVKGWVELYDSDLEDEQNVDDVMGQLGGQYIGKKGSQHYFAFDVIPATGELAPAVKTKISNIYYQNFSKFKTGLYAQWTGN